jgi:hypothetical protein
MDAHGKEFGIGRPYLDRDPPHVAPIDGKRICRALQRSNAQGLTGKIVEGEKRLAHLKKAFQDGRASEHPGQL